MWYCQRRKAASWINKSKGVYIAEMTERHWLDLTLQGLHTPFCSPTCNISVPFLSASSFLPLPFSCSPLLSTRLAPFSLTVRRYLKDQITMATISHIVIAHTRVWWLFLFCRVCRCAFTSLADRQVTCSGEEGTTLPSVGSMCLHTITDAPKHPALPWWLMTVNHLPIKTFGFSQVWNTNKFQTHTCQRSPSLKRSTCTIAVSGMKFSTL